MPSHAAHGNANGHECDEENDSVAMGSAGVVDNNATARVADTEEAIDKEPREAVTMPRRKQRPSNCVTQSQNVSDGVVDEQIPQRLVDEALTQLELYREQAEMTCFQSLAN